MRDLGRRDVLKTATTLGFAMLYGAAGFARAVAGGFRLLLPVRQAGLLVVRSRLTDVLCYLGLAVAITTLGLALPA